MLLTLNKSEKEIKMASEAEGFSYSVRWHLSILNCFSSTLSKEESLKGRGHCLRAGLLLSSPWDVDPRTASPEGEVVAVVSAFFLFILHSIL